MSLTTALLLPADASALVLGLALATASPTPARAQTAIAPPVAGPALASHEKPDLFIHRFYGAPEDAGLPAGYPNVAFCGGNDGQGGAARRVYFEVHNRGSVGAPASLVRVEFTNPGNGQTRVADVAVEPLAAHTHVVKRVTIPAACYSQGPNAVCQFVITADPAQRVAERFENNNAQRSSCVGPTF